MNKYHQEILEEIKKFKKKPEEMWPNIAYYLGTSHPVYGLSAKEGTDIAKIWARTHKDISTKELCDMLDSLYAAESFDEKWLAGRILQQFPKLRPHIHPRSIKQWLCNLAGWAEIDSLCQSAFGANDMFLNWNAWEKALQQFAKGKSIAHRRASLVLLVTPVRQSADERFSGLAFDNVERLKSEKDILITKAVSWILRDMIQNHKEEVGEYLLQNRDTLPKIALREATRKLTTGKK